MLSIFVGFLTVVLVLDCAFLVLLVLLQLPKKEAGAGTAFGGGATDVLFGAGTGNVLTKATSYAAGVFLGLCLILAILQNHMASSKGNSLKKALSTPIAGTAPATPKVDPSAIQVPSIPVTTNTGTAPAAPVATGDETKK